MLNTTLLIGADWTYQPNLDVYFWLRAIAGVFVLLAFLIVFDWYLKRVKPRSPEAPKEEVPRSRGGARRRRRVPFITAMVVGLLPAVGRADDQTDDAASKAAPAITVGAAVETYFGWNFNRPENGVTAFRGFDARHNSFALSNAVIDTRWSAGAVSGRLALQTGDTPDIYYGAEATNDVRHVLEATVAWKAPAGKGLTFDGGIFLSPIGPESVLIKDNWNWSRSTLFFGLPFYHAGFRATYPVTERWNVTAAVYNGWNNVTDTNGKKSVSVQGLYTKPDKVTWSVLYFGGVERPRGSAEGQPWRHLFDSHVTVTVSPRLSLQLHGDAGFENTTLGRSSWRAGAFAARLKANNWLFVAGRADILDETTPSSSAGAASSLFFPTTRVRSLTGTLDARPVDRISIRLELRHDKAADFIYFKASNPVASAKAQTTLTLGMTAWF